MFIITNKFVPKDKYGTLPDDIVEGREFISFEQGMGQSVDADAVAIAGRRWYLPHGIEATVRRIEARL